MVKEKIEKRMSLLTSFFKVFIHQPKLSSFRHGIEQLMCQIHSLSGENSGNREFVQKVSAGMTEDVRQRTENRDRSEAPETSGK